MQNLQVGLGAVLALDTSAFLARQPPPRQPETTRHDGITPSNTPPSIRHPTHRLLWDAPENRASGPPSTANGPSTLSVLGSRVSVPSLRYVSHPRWLPGKHELRLLDGQVS